MVESHPSHELLLLAFAAEPFSTLVADERITTAGNTHMHRLPPSQSHTFQACCVVAMHPACQNLGWGLDKKLGKADL